MVGEIEGLKPKRRDLRPIVRLQLQNKEGLKRFAVRSQLGLKQNKEVLNEQRTITVFWRPPRGERVKADR